MKKILALALTTAIMFTFAACGNTEGQPDNPPIGNEATEAPQSADGTPTAPDEPDAAATPDTSDKDTENTDTGDVNPGNIDLGDIDLGDIDPSNIGDIDVDAIFGGSIEESMDIIYGKADAVTKQALLDAAEEEGVDVTFNSDGSTTFVDADGAVTKQNADGTWTYVDPDGSQGQLGGDWPDNEYTRLIPKPDFDVTAASTTEQDFTAAFVGVTMDQIYSYVEKVKASGFDKNPDTVDTEMMGISVYSYYAENGSYSISIYSTSGNSGIIISRY